MKHILAILATFMMAATAHAQWSRFAPQPKVSKLDYTIDTFRYHGEAVAVQRYKETDLNTVIGKDARENRVALALKPLQSNLTYSQKELIDGKVFDMENARKLVDEINEQKTNFDPSLLQKEIDFYDKFASRIKTEKAMEQYKKNVAWEEEKRQQKVKDSTDKSLAAIEKAKKDSAQAQHDREVNAAIDKEEARKAAALKKKYGAAAYAKAEKGTPWIGMPEELVEVAVGTPSNKNTSNTAQGKQEEWLYYYNDDMIWTHRIVLRNHVVTAIYSRE